MEEHMALDAAVTHDGGRHRHPVTGVNCVIKIDPWAGLVIVGRSGTHLWTLAQCSGLESSRIPTVSCVTRLSNGSQAWRISSTPVISVAQKLLPGSAGLRLSLRSGATSIPAIGQSTIPTPTR